MDALRTQIDSGGGGLMPRRTMHADAEFDITAMIDLVFMMNIYFLVTFVTAAFGEIDLPAANHAVALDGDKATLVTVLAGTDSRSVKVLLGEAKEATPILEAIDQDNRIANAVERAAAEGKSAVLIKAEKGVRLREIKRIASAASREGMTLHIAIMEKDVAP